MTASAKPVVIKGKSGVPAGAIEYTREKIEALKQTVAKGATDAEFEMFLHLAQHYGLDPFKKEMWFIKRVRKEKKYVNGKEVWDYPRLPDGSIDYSQAETVIMTSRDGYLSYAQRDENYAGLRGGVVHANDHFVITQTLDGEKVEHTFTHKNRGPIVGAWAAAFHKERPPVVAYVPLDEYIDNNSPIWRKNTSAMILKVAEAFVLKRQFGITGLVTAEEMGTDLSAVERGGNVIVETETVGEERVQSEVPPRVFESRREILAPPAGEKPGESESQEDEKKASEQPETPPSEPEPPQAEQSEGQYSGAVTAVSSPAVTKDGKKVAVRCEDGEGELVLVFTGDKTDAGRGIEAGCSVDVTGQLKIEKGKRYVLVEEAEVIPF